MRQIVQVVLILSLLPASAQAQPASELPELGECRQTHRCPEGSTCRCAYEGNDLVLEERALDGEPYLRIVTDFELGDTAITIRQAWDRGADGSWDRRATAQFGMDGSGTISWDWGPETPTDWVCRTGESCTSIMSNCPLNCERVAPPPAPLASPPVWSDVCQRYAAMCPGSSEEASTCLETCQSIEAPQDEEACWFRYCGVDVGLCDNDEGGDDLILACARERGWLAE